MTLGACEGEDSDDQGERTALTHLSLEAKGIDRDLVRIAWLLWNGVVAEHLYTAFVVLGSAIPRRPAWSVHLTKALLSLSASKAGVKKGTLVLDNSNLTKRTNQVLISSTSDVLA